MFFEKLLNYNWSYVADWMIATIIVLTAAFFMIVVGFVWMKRASKKYNCIYGYRTFRAKSSVTVWEYVNRTAGRAWMVIGLILFLLDVFTMFRCMHGYYEQILVNALKLLLLELFCCFFCHFYVKRKEKMKFGA